MSLATFVWRTRPTTNRHQRHDQRPRGVRLTAALSCLEVALLSAGCLAPQRTFQPEQDPNTLDEVAFLHYLATVPVVTVDEGMRAVLLLKEVPIQPPTFDRRFESLQQVDAVKTTWRLSSERILDKGTLAYMLSAVCGLPRSFNELIAWTTGLGERRYALKTCVYEGLMPYGRSHEPVTGGELLSALTAAESYLASRSPETP